MPYVLETEEIVVAGETLVVSQASNLMDVQRSVLIDEAEKTFQQVDDSTGEKYRRYMSTLLYPSLVACTQGNVPTLEEFLHSLIVDESDKWIDTAQRLNPRWFRFLKMGEEPDDSKKE